MSSPPEARIRTEVQVMFFDTDCAAVVHNIAYLRFIETARTLLAGKLGMSLAEMARSQQYPVVVRTEIDYKRPAALGDNLAIDGWLERVERIRFWCGFTVTRPADGALLIRCRQMLALVQMPAGRPVRLPEEWQTRYAHLRGGVPDAEAVSSRMHGGEVLS
jgi:YbgC/YbaW family acyl-CoA thioester hydrolase